MPILLQCMHTYLRQLRSQEADFRCEVQLTCLSLPLVKHGVIEVRILFHVSSLAAKTEVSRGPESKSCEHQRIGDSCKRKWEIGDFKVLIMCKLRFKCHLFFISVKTWTEVRLLQYALKQHGVAISQIMIASLTVNAFNQLRWQHEDSHPVIGEHRVAFLH